MWIWGKPLLKKYLVQTENYGECVVVEAETYFIEHTTDNYFTATFYIDSKAIRTIIRIMGIKESK